MEIPAKRVCDLCKGELTGTYMAMSYPLNEADRELLRAQLEAEGAVIPRGAVVGFTYDPTPPSWRFDFCRGCVDGFIPLLADLKKQAIDAWLADRKRRLEAVAEAER